MDIRCGKNRQKHENDDSFDIGISRSFPKIRNRYLSFIYSDVYHSATLEMSNSLEKLMFPHINQFTGVIVLGSENGGRV